jgi:hypothetical protein
MVEVREKKLKKNLTKSGKWEKQNRKGELMQ